MEPCSLLIGAGVVGALFLAKRFARRRFMYGRYAMAGCGPGAHGGGLEGHDHRGGRGRWRGGGGSFSLLRGFLRRIDATPAQEKEIRAALDDLRAATKEAKQNLEASRANLAHAIGGETFDEIAMGEANVSFDRATAQGKEALEAALRRVHAVLDATQRETLGALIEAGPWGRGAPWGGPYRS